MSFRALLAQGEGERLDYKRELPEPLKVVRCIMAIANGLRIDQRGYILIGVIERDDHTGEVVGITPGSHVDDADIHDWVANRLNRVPSFSYKAYQEDGKEIGILEIIGTGKRPFYPLQNSPRGRSLSRHVPLYRNGSRVDIAPPDVVIEWWKEDHSIEDELARSKLAEQRARQEPLFAVQIQRHHYCGPHDPQRQRQNPPPALLSMSLLIRNIGSCAAKLISFRAKWRLIDDPSVVVPREINSITLAHSLREYGPGDDAQSSVDLPLEAAAPFIRNGVSLSPGNVELVIEIEERSLPFNQQRIRELPPIGIPLPR